MTEEGHDTSNVKYAVTKDLGVFLEELESVDVPRVLMSYTGEVEGSKQEFNAFYGIGLQVMNFQVLGSEVSHYETFEGIIGSINKMIKQKKIYSVGGRIEKMSGKGLIYYFKPNKRNAYRGLYLREFENRINEVCDAWLSIVEELYNGSSRDDIRLEVIGGSMLDLIQGSVHYRVGLNNGMNGQMRLNEVFNKFNAFEVKHKNL